jgi:adenosylcobinamide-phosphate synthase
MSEPLRWLCVLCVASILDGVVGEPPTAWHPVAWMGRAIALFRSQAPIRGRWLPLLSGGAWMVVGIASVLVLTLLLLVGLRWLPWPLAVLAEAYLFKTTFSVRGLLAAGRSVESPLAAGDLPEARRLLAWHLVSRDTSPLDGSQVAAAAIESLAENTSDSCIAPWLYYAVGGVPAAMAYRFINTCDAMLGYRDAEREWLGKIPARTDDVANFLPARATALLMVLAACLPGYSARQAWVVLRRDRKLTASPNAGHPMSAAAGALQVELEKVGHYCLGRGARAPVAADILRMRRLLLATTLAGLATATLAVAGMLAATTNRAGSGSVVGSHLPVSKVIQLPSERRSDKDAD